MLVLIYLLIIAAIVIWVNILISYFSESWRKWQTKQIEHVSEKLYDSFIFMERRKLALLSFSPFVCAGVVFLFIPNIVGIVIGFIVGLALPAMIMNIVRQNRIKQFQGQLIDTLMILSSSLKGGLSFIQAVEVVCEEMPPPISQEFGLVLKENKLGVTLDESLMALRERMPLEEVNLLVSSILVAKVTGGELTHVLSRLVETIRNNIKLKEKINTLTLQGKLQGIIMAFLPMAFALFIYKQDPHHFDIMLDNQLGKTLLVIAVIGQLVGMYLIKRISTLRI